MDDLLFKPLDRFAFGFGETQRRQGCPLLLQNAAFALIWAAVAKATSGCFESLAGGALPMLGARLTSAGHGFGVSSERA